MWNPKTGESVRVVQGQYFLDDFMSNNMRMRSTQVDFACLICWVGPYCVPLPSVVLPIPCLGAFKKSCW